MKKVSYLIALALWAVNFLPGEYLVFKEKLQLLSPDEHAKILEIFLTHQWPMCLMHAANFGVKEHEQYLRSGSGCLEEWYLRRKIHACIPTANLIFIPTFVYELFLADSKLDLEVEVDEPIADQMKDPKSTRQAIMKIFAEKHDSDTFRNAHYRFNKQIIEYLMGTYPQWFAKPPYGIGKSQYEQVTLRLLATGSGKKLGVSEDIARKLIAVEWQAMLENKAILWRVNRHNRPFCLGKLVMHSLECAVMVKNYCDPGHISADIDAFYDLLGKRIRKELQKNQEQELKDFLALTGKRILDLTLPSRTISFGNSVLAGHAYEQGAGGACVNFFLGDSNATAYALSIDKFRYVNGLLNQLFSISPLHTILGFYGKGEFFHSRSRVFSEKKQDIEPTGLSLMTGLCDQMGYLVNAVDPLEYGARLVLYIAQHAEVIRVSNMHGGWDLESESAKRYIKALIGDQRKLGIALRFLARFYKVSMHERRAKRQRTE